MARRTPAVKQKIKKQFDTKEKALKFSSDERKKALESGVRKRFDVVQDVTTGRWNVIELTFETGR
jgi:hypothetical protein